MILLALLVGCQCGGPSEPQAPPVPSHFGRFDALVSAAVAGDVQTAQFVARSLQEGDVAEPADDDGGAERVGGALGFVQIAEDSAEVIDGVASAAIGCGQCHTASKVQRPELGPWTHENAGLRLVLGAVFPPIEPPPWIPEPLGDSRKAWDDAVDPEDTDASDPDVARLAAALQACVRCHAK